MVGATLVVMARKVTSMKAIAAVVALGAGERINVSSVCREAGISRKTFYKWHAPRVSTVSRSGHGDRSGHRVR